MKKLPSEREQIRIELKAAKDESEEERQREQERLRRSVEAVLKTDAGKELWAWIYHRCGWASQILTVGKDGDIATINTECLAAQREVYRDLRQLAPRELRVRAEEFAEFGAGELESQKPKEGGK